LKQILAKMTNGTAAVAAVAAGDMVAYSGYDMEVAVSSTLDNGMVAVCWLRHGRWFHR
jgi:hypothetical protein